MTITISKSDPFDHRCSEADASDISAEVRLNFWHKLVSEQVAAEFLDLSMRTLQGYRLKGGGPKFVRIGSRAVRYLRLDLKAWADGCRANSTSDYSEGGDV